MSSERSVSLWGEYVDNCNQSSPLKTDWHITHQPLFTRSCCEDCLELAHKKLLFRLTCVAQAEGGKTRPHVKRNWMESVLSKSLNSRKSRSRRSSSARRPACLAAPCDTARKPKLVTEQVTHLVLTRAQGVRGRGAHRDTTTPKIATTRRRTAPMTTIIAMAHVGILSFDSSDRFASC